MKRSTIFLSGLLTLILSSCTSYYKSTYFGDYYTPTYEVSLYYDEEDIPLNFKVIGNVKNSEYLVSRLSPAQLRDEMIKKAKTVGADAILVTMTTPSKNDKGNKIVESRFLRFKDY